MVYFRLLYVRVLYARFVSVALPTCRTNPQTILFSAMSAKYCSFGPTMETEMILKIECGAVKCAHWRGSGVYEVLLFDSVLPFACLVELSLVLSNLRVLCSDRKWPRYSQCEKWVRSNCICLAGSFYRSALSGVFFTRTGSNDGQNFDLGTFVT